uniref:Uncharacterized protein n=1 Tax=Arundo donax TaxID=35708 RepID=A0A0A9C8W3_ARUDO
MLLNALSGHIYVTKKQDSNHTLPHHQSVACMPLNSEDHMGFVPSPSYLSPSKVANTICFLYE